MVVNNATASTGTASGALTVAGGVGIAGDVNVGGNVVMLGGATVYTQSPSTSVGAGTVTIDTFATSDYRSAKYIVSLSNSSTGEYQTSEVLLVQNGTNSFLQSTSVFSGSAAIGTFSTSVAGSNVVLQVTGTAAGVVAKTERFYVTA